MPLGTQISNQVLTGFRSEKFSFKKSPIFFSHMFNFKGGGAPGEGKSAEFHIKIQHYCSFEIPIPDQFCFIRSAIRDEPLSEAKNFIARPTQKSEMGAITYGSANIL